MTEREKALMYWYFTFLDAFNFKGEMRRRGDYLPPKEKAQSARPPHYKSNPFELKGQTQAEILAAL